MVGRRWSRGGKKVNSVQVSLRDKRVEIGPVYTGYKKIDICQVCRQKRTYMPYQS